MVNAGGMAMSELEVIQSSNYRTPEQLPSTNEDRLELTQNVRLQFVQLITAGGTRIPTDQEQGKLLLTALNDMDKTTLGAMRQKSDDGKMAKDQLVAEALLALGQKMGNNSAFRVENPQPRSIPLLIDESLLPEVVVVPGEIDTGVQSIAYTDLANRFARGQVALIEQD